MPYGPDMGPRGQPAPGVTSYQPPVNPQSQFLNNFWNAYQQGVINPQLASDNSQIQNLLSQLQIGQAQGGLQGQQLQQQYGFDTARLGLSQDQLGIQQGALNRSNAYLPQQQALTEQMYGLQGQQLGLQGQQLDLQGQGLDTARQQLQYGAGEQTRAAQSSAVARGALGSQGLVQQMQDIGAQTGFANQQLQQQGQGLDLSRQGLDLSRQQQGINQQQQRLSYQDQLSSNADAQKQLDVTARGLGIAGDELRSRLDNALQQIGLSNALSSDQVVGEIAKIRNGEFSILSNIMPMLSQFAGLNLFAG